MTGLLVRSTAQKWAKGSVLAVDAGVHMSAITRILSEHDPDPATSNGNSNGRMNPKRNGKGAPDQLDGVPTSSYPTPEQTTTERGSPAAATPFDGLKLPHKSARANAAYITRELVSTYLITHPHMDHICAFVVNTASFQHTSRPKRLAALPSTIDAIKTHVFNNVIWPNMSDEDDGIGLISYMRLTEGGNVAVGTGEGKGYIEVCEGLAVKSWTVSHGHCTKKIVQRNSNSGLENEYSPMSQRRGSSPAALRHTASFEQRHRRPSYNTISDTQIVDSSAFFIRDEATGKEVLIFGDVEPDSIAIEARTLRVWHEAAPKVASGTLGAIFIECSYTDSQTDDSLFGHLCPRHLVKELKQLAGIVGYQRKRPQLEATFQVPERNKSKRKRMEDDEMSPTKPRKSKLGPKRDRSAHDGADDVDDSPGLLADQDLRPYSEGALKGLKVVIIHVKDLLHDGPPAGDTILRQLEEGAGLNGLALGCEFIVSSSGESVWV